MNKGIGYAIGAYAAWGLFPIYWKWLHSVPALELLSHRIVWSFLLLLPLSLLSPQWQVFRTTALTSRTLRVYGLAALLLSINWLTYVWAVNAGFIIETSLGYFINPLLSVLMGVIFLRERLRPGQWLPIGLAAAGVLYLTLSYGSLPWIALTLAFSFATYGLVKKAAPLGALHGLTLETGILFLPALLYLIYAQATGLGAFLHAGPVSDGLLVGSGVVTTIPLLMFASAARRIPLSLIGLLQYQAPTLQFLLGLLVYGEPFTPSQLFGFSAVWVALIIFSLEGLIVNWMRPAPVAAAEETQPG